MITRFMTHKKTLLFAVYNRWIMDSIFRPIWSFIHPDKGLLQWRTFGHHFVNDLFYDQIFSPFSLIFVCLVYQSYINVLDDQLNRWVKGQIYQLNRSEDFRCIIKYGGTSFIMENKLGSLITEIRDQKRPNYILSRFYETYFDPFFGSSRYNIQIYTDDLPDPLYILALSALDSRIVQRRVRFIP
jgi:hypothetical protein